LIPDPTLRRLVLGTGILLAVVGVAAIGVLPVSPAMKLLLCASWCGMSVRELLHIANGYKACCRLQVDASGTVQVFDRQGACRRARIEAGSMVFWRIAWLRLRGPQGSRHSELLGCNVAKVHDWRRFQVIWRHLGAVA
jgi:hypothetical protein